MAWSPAIVYDLRRRIRDTLQLFIQSKNELRKREALARIRRCVHGGMLKVDGRDLERRRWGRSSRKLPIGTGHN